MIEIGKMAEDPHGEDGWKRRSVLDEPRLTEVVEAYRFLGLEVKVVDIDLKREADCVSCLEGSPDLYRIVYTRKPRHSEKTDGNTPIDQLFR